MNRQRFLTKLLLINLIVLFIGLALPARAEVRVTPYVPYIMTDEDDCDNILLPDRDRYAIDPYIMARAKNAPRDRYAENPRFLRGLTQQVRDQRVRELRPYVGNWNSRDRRVEGLRPKSGNWNERDQRVRELRPYVGNWNYRDRQVEDLKPQVGNWNERD